MPKFINVYIDQQQVKNLMDKQKTGTPSTLTLIDLAYAILHNQTILNDKLNTPTTEITIIQKILEKYIPQIMAKVEAGNTVILDKLALMSTKVNTQNKFKS